MMGKEIEKKIEDLRCRLYRLIENDPQCLSRCEVISLSQYLDKVMNSYYNYHYN